MDIGQLFNRENLVVLHPFLLGLSPILYIFSRNMDKVPVTALFMPVAAVVLVTATVMFLARYRGIPVSRIAPLVSVVFIWFFWYRFIGNIDIGSQPLFLYLRVILYFAVLIIVLWVLTHTRRDVTHLNNVLCIIGATLILISVGSILGGAPAAAGAGPVSTPAFGPDLSSVPVSLGVKPDIYYIILDSYAGSDSLTRYFNFDNHDFLNGLRQRGFIVENHSLSNYNLTLYSVTSSLNMEYLPDTTDSSLISRQYGNNTLYRFLKAQGYTTCFIDTGYTFLDRNQQADVTINPGLLTDFDRACLDMSYIGVYMHILDKKIRNDRIFGDISKIASIPGPKFVYIHVGSPHTPYIMSRDGSLVIPPPSVYDNPAYLNELIYLNGQVLKAVDTLQSSSPVPSVIIIQGDHGARLRPKPANETRFMTTQILNAYYLPGSSPGEIPENVTPVNSFRVVLNQYLGTNLPLLPEKTYYEGRWFSVPYNPDDPGVPVTSGTIGGREIPD